MTEKPNACCNVAENLEDKTDNKRPDLTVLVCRICGRRHFELAVDPVALLATGKDI